MQTLKVLVADDEPVARRVLTGFLEKEKYEVTIAEDGMSALKQLSSADGPAIAILDWMMPGMTGLQVCRSVRSANLKIRPYVLMVSAKASKNDITAALDAGADDYITKPFNPGELLARLRVARRTVAYQLELHHQIGLLESLAQRYNLLGEIAAAQSARARGQASIGVPAVEADSSENRQGPSAERIDATMIRTLFDLGLGRAVRAEIDHGTVFRPMAFTAWAGLVYLKEQVWIDLLFEVDAAGAAAVFQKLLKRTSGSHRETLDFLAETQTIISAAFRNESLARGADVITPIFSRALRTGEAHHRVMPVPPERETHTYALPGYAIRLTVVRRPDCIELKTAGQLSESDILAEPFPPPEVSDLPLLSQGVVLSDRFIEKLSSMAESELKTLLVPIFRASPLAQYFTHDDE